jgi:hypothetical protein
MPAKRTRRADVEQRLARRNDAAHADDGAHRAERRQERHRDEVRERRVHLVKSRRDVVPELVSEKDRQERSRRTARRQTTDVVREKDRVPLRAPVMKTLTAVATKSHAFLCQESRSGCRVEGAARAPAPASRLAASGERVAEGFGESLELGGKLDIEGSKVRVDAK